MANRKKIPSRAPVPPPTPEASSTKSALPTIVGGLVGVALGAGGLAAATWSSGCSSEKTQPPGPSATLQTAPAEESGVGSLPEPPGLPRDPVEDEAEAPLEVPSAEPEEPTADKPWEGPWLGALAQATPIYPTARFSKQRIGYIRRGGKVPVVDKPIKTASCKQGFYPLVDGGYVCGKYATTKIDDLRIKNGVRPPNVDALLPYKYAYNRAHGTPLYISVPSKDEMLEYEPYLRDDNEKKRAKRNAKDAEAHAEDADKPRTESDDATQVARAPSPAPSGSAAELAPLPSASGSASPPPKPWWQNDAVDVKLSDLDESDGTIRSRMVKGFFIAVDKTFGWNNRLWYKTTEGLIAPTDRMIIPKTPTLKGVELDDEVTQVGFVLWRKGYRYDFEGDKLKRGKRLERYESFALTGTTKVHKSHRYRETAEGWWFKEDHGTFTDPGKRPDEVDADEKWIDVNLKRRTLVAFIGDKPVYATLISPGKKSSNRRKDHRTKVGKWRVREKHITTTMDGDGPAGDLPYSIQDVPYVQYYDGSYALHGAFWHNSFGHQKSHGCVNLSPADAKYLFHFTEPSLPRGWHGVWSSEKRAGTLVVVHE
ncbi:MAG: L,D-transpeptidase [Myxococcota bacterium]